MSDTDEALKVWNAMTPMVDRQIADRTRDCVRSTKMIVKTAPANGVIGVSLPYDNTVVSIPYEGTVSGASVGDAVWVTWYYNDMSTMRAVLFGDGSSTYSRDSYANVTWLAAADNYFGTTRQLTFYRRGKIAMIIPNLSVKSTAPSSNTVVGTAPAGFAPPTAVYISGAIQNSSDTYFFEIDTNREIHFAHYGSTGGFARFNAAYPIAANNL